MLNHENLINNKYYIPYFSMTLASLFCNGTNILYQSLKTVYIFKLCISSIILSIAMGSIVPLSSINHQIKISLNNFYIFFPYFYFCFHISLGSKLKNISYIKIIFLYFYPHYVFSFQFSIYSFQFSIYSFQFSVFNLQFSVFNFQFTVFRFHFSGFRF